jgi:Tol biopolymer transport system component
MRARSVLLTFSAALSFAASHAEVSAQDTVAIPIPVRRIPLGDSVTSITATRLSPDGRWVVAAVGVGQAEFTNLWAIPTGGGAPVRLTTGNYRDAVPRWFPAGDKIVFVSNRTSRTTPVRDVAMVLSFDPASGLAVGEPRQISLDALRMPAPGLAVSPDGRSITYAEAGSNRIKVIPATGGAARLVAETAVGPGNITWSEDGRYILYTLRTPNADQWRLLRVPAAGGPSQELLSRAGPTGGLVPGGRHMVFASPIEPGATTRELRIADATGRVQTAYVVNRGVTFEGWGNFSTDGRHLVGSEVSNAAWVRVASLMGGRIVTLTSPVDSYDWPLGWLPGDSVVIWREVRGENSIIVKSARGGPERILALPARSMRPIGLVGTQITFGLPQPTPGPARLMSMSLATGATREVLTDGRALQGFPVYGPGGAERPGPDGFFQVTETGDRRELWERSLTGTSRLLRSFPRTAVTTGIGVHGDRVAFCELKGDTALLVVAEGPDAPARRLATLGERRPERARDCGRDIVFSNSGRWIVADYTPGQVLVVDTRAEGGEAPRVLDVNSSWSFGPAWLPDDSGVTMMSELPAPSHILHLSLRGGPPITITQEDPSPKYGYYLSPDGRAVVYPAEIPQGSSVVIFDLPTPLR